MTSNIRCAKTVPTIVAHVPGRRRRCRVTTATRASSPTRPGSAAFPSRPTQKAEKTTRQRGHGGGTACVMTMRQADERTATENRLMTTAIPTQNHDTARKASPTSERSGPRQTTSAATPATTAATSAARAVRLRGNRTRSLAHRQATRLVLEHLYERGGKRSGLSRRHEHGALRGRHGRIALDVGR